MEKCVRRNPVNTKVREGEEGGGPDSREEISLQLMETPRADIHIVAWGGAG